MLKARQNRAFSLHNVNNHQFQLGFIGIGKAGILIIPLK